jgi:hypothetical protein
MTTTPAQRMRALRARCRRREVQLTIEVTTMTTTPAQRMRALRARCRRREVQLTIEVSETDLREIALAGYADAASTDRKAQAQAGRTAQQAQA